ncbi:MAG: hypothetical protein IKT38_07095 [Clostridia bacterium]|nr:hypothetical protein [Clostridia bacterium]
MGIFKKSNLFENLKIFKKSDKDIHCANCATRTGVITRQWLLDDKCLCVNCQNAIPTYFQRNYGSLTFDTYKVMESYMLEESKELGKQFKKKYTFLDLQLDAVNGILRYKTSNANPLYVKLENILNFCLDYHNSTSSITMTLECIEPYFLIHEDLILAGSEYECNQFMNYYHSIRTMREGENYLHKEQGGAKFEYESFVNNNSDEVQLQKALALFMFDSINEVTVETLKAQRNRLIKSFHPDANSDDNTRYAQKINEAYELIHNHLK